MTYSDDHLQDYLAGSLPPETAAKLEADLSTDTELEARLFALDYAQAAPLRDAFEHLPNAAGLQGLEALVRDGNADAKLASPPSMWKWPAAAAVAAFAAGAFLFAGQTSDAKAGWQNQVAVYQTLYVTETLASTDATTKELTAQLANSERAVGRTLPLDVVGELDGMKLLRAQVLGFDGAPLIQMAYLSDDGVPVALCAIRLATPATQQPTFETLSGLPAVHWSDGSFGYMIVGDIDRGLLMDMAEKVSASL